MSNNVTEITEEKILQDIINEYGKIVYLDSSNISKNTIRIEEQHTSSMIEDGFSLGIGNTIDGWLVYGVSTYKNIFGNTIDKEKICEVMEINGNLIHNDEFGNIPTRVCICINSIFVLANTGIENDLYDWVTLYNFIELGTMQDMQEMVKRNKEHEELWKYKTQLSTERR